MAADLAFQAFGQGPPLVILHGLLGSKRNWSAIAKALSADHHVFCLDARNHGDSPWTDGMDYATLAEDVRAFIKAHGLGRATVIGHSMGGKTAMALALLHPESVAALVVVDIAPVINPATDVQGYLEIMTEMPLAAFSTRAEAEDYLAGPVPEAAVRGFLLQNLVRDGERLRWRNNLAAIADGMEDIKGFIEPGHGRAYRGPCLFLAGGDSPYVQPRDHAVIRGLFPKAGVQVIPGAGHWLHAEQPAAFMGRLKEFLDDNQGGR